jgi:hypothetical protein
MNNHAPIKRHEALRTFSRDHHFGLLLVWKIRQGLDNVVAPQRISNYVLHFFEQDLSQHFEEEERSIFLLLPIGNVLRTQAEKEHTILKCLIEQIRNDGENKGLLLQFAAALKDHIRFEERELFAAVEQATGDHGLATLETNHSNRGKQADADWHDPFWIIEK